MILQLQNITYSYGGKLPLIKNVSLQMEDQKIYTLMGPNGSGKTTLFNILTGFLKPHGGEIIYYPISPFGEKKEVRLTHLPPFKINRIGISRTFQELRLITKLTVLENIILAMSHNPTDNWLNAMLPEIFKSKTNTSLEAKANQIIEQFFLSDIKYSLAAEISYGQQKLLTLACCVANGATLLLLDEAVAGIQPEYRIKVAMLIKQLKEQGKTILLIEHNIDFIADVADNIFFLHNGEISIFENMDYLRKDKHVIETFI